MDKDTLFKSDWEIQRIKEVVSVSGSGAFTLYTFAGSVPVFHAQAKSNSSGWSYLPGQSEGTFQFYVYRSGTSIIARTSSSATVKLYVWEDLL